jgi:hypothetical protein
MTLCCLQVRSSRIQLEASVQQRSNPAPSDVLHQIGFGATPEDNRINQFVNVDAISYNTCNQQYGGDIINELYAASAGKIGKSMQ